MLVQTSACWAGTENWEEQQVVVLRLEAGNEVAYRLVASAAFVVGAASDLVAAYLYHCNQYNM